jgi:putative acetyltransferase
VIIRAATSRDVAWLADMAHDAYQNVFRPLLPDVDWSRFDDAFFTARFEHDLDRVTIACQSSERLGFSLVTGTHLDMLFVAPGGRNGGVGALLFGGATTLECFAVNSAARRFYERHGWRASRYYSRNFGGVDCEFVAYAR